MNPEALDASNDALEEHSEKAPKVITVPADSAGPRQFEARVRALDMLNNVPKAHSWILMYTLSWGLVRF